MLQPASAAALQAVQPALEDRKSTRLNSSHMSISYAVFCLKKKKRPAPGSIVPDLPCQRITERCKFLYELASCPQQSDTDFGAWLCPVPCSVDGHAHPRV